LKRAGSLNENPLKEMRCMAYLTRKLREGGLPGDTTRLLPLLDLYEDASSVYLVMPVLPGGDALNFVNARGGPFTEPEAFAFLRDLLDGLEVAHALGLAHHDMSFEIVMMDDYQRPVIIDWGMVVKVPVTGHGTPVKVAPTWREGEAAPRPGWPFSCGKPVYHAPELFQPAARAPGFDPFALDMWALGFMLVTLLLGIPPWETPPLVAGPAGTIRGDVRFNRIADGGLAALLTAWGFTQVSADAVALAQALLSRDPAARPSIAQVRASAWFQRQGQPPAP
jgi:serine/threonine protein kinase